MHEVDLHSHSLFSRCGVHSVIEILEAARERGLKAQAITDHGPAKVDRINSTFFTRLIDPVPGIKLLKGMECNLTDKMGHLDMDEKRIPDCDVLLAGIHDNIRETWTDEEATEALLGAMRLNPWLDIITHPLCREYKIDLRAAARVARETGKALEFNNSKIRLGYISSEEQKNFIRICMEEDCLVAVNTDAHTVNELGDTEAMDLLLKEEGFPEERIVNKTFDGLMKWLEERRVFKLKLSLKA